MAQITAFSGNVNFKYSVNGTPITGFENDSLNPSDAVTVLATSIDSITANPNPVQVSNFGSTPTLVDGTVVITFTNISSETSGSIDITLSNFADTNYALVGYTIGTGSQVTSDLTTKFTIPAIAAGANQTLSIEVKYTGTPSSTVAQTPLVIVANEVIGTTTNTITLPTIEAQAVFAILSGTIQVVDASNNPQTNFKVANGNPVYYLVSITNSGNAATTITEPILTLDIIDFTLSEVWAAATVGSLAKLASSDYSFGTDASANVLTINPATPVTITATNGTYYFRLVGKANYIAS